MIDKISLRMQPAKALKLLFADLTYDTIVLVSDTMPINIGFIAAYSIKYLQAKSM